MTTTAEIIVSVGVVALVILWGQVLWLQRRINALDAHRSRLAKRIWELHREALTTVTAHTQRLEEQIAELRSAPSAGVLTARVLEAFQGAGLEAAGVVDAISPAGRTSARALALTLPA